MKRYEGWLLLARAYRVTGPISVFMESISHREFQVRLAHERQLWNQPDRRDHYAMQTAAEVRKVLHKHPEKVKLEHLKLNFTFPDAKDTTAQLGMTREEAAAIAKAKWFGIAGAIGKVGKIFLSKIRGSK